MTPELMYLVWSAALTLGLAVIAVSGATLDVGLPRLAGNREGTSELPNWAGRAARAHRCVAEKLLHVSSSAYNVAVPKEGHMSNRRSYLLWLSQAFITSGCPVAGCKRRSHYRTQLSGCQLDRSPAATFRGWLSEPPSCRFRRRQRDRN